MLNARRRGLMGKTAGSILWKIEGYAFQGGFVNTELALCDTDRDFSIAYDVTLDTDPSTGDGSRYRLLRVLNEQGANYTLALYKGENSKFLFRFMEQAAELSGSATGRLRFVITHAKNSDAASVYFRKQAESPITRTVSASFAASSKNLILGQSSGSLQLPKGTLNRVAVYGKVLSAAKINDFLGV